MVSTSRTLLSHLCVVCFSLAPLSLVAQDVAPVERNSASSTTRTLNEHVRTVLPFHLTDDFDLANRGFVGRSESLVIRDASDRVVWDMDRFAFQTGQSPSSVNPSLWRQAKLNALHGLFKVTDRVYQVRGYDLSNLSIIEGDTGYIIVDPLITAEAASAAMDLVYEHLPRKPVVAVIYSHSHADHFGGVKGVVSEESVRSGKARIIAPEGFMEFAVSENVLAGNVMSRRASYMYGSLLPPDEKGAVDAGLGKTISAGNVTLIEPTDIVTGSREEIVIDGVRMVFMNAPFSEAPAELMFYLPQMNAFYVAEEANATMHNIYTLRGAQVRDALLWSGYLQDAIGLINPQTEVLFGGHHWPRWGYDNIVDYLQKQGDMYRYIHDQTLRLANHGYTINEIPEMLALPDELEQEWFNRGYYGTVRHNSRAVYQKYLGYFDGNPANLNRLEPSAAAKKYVEFIGGADELLIKARRSYKKGEYRWVAEVVNHLVFADPDNAAALALQADALEQMGYQAESGPWRNFYLSGATELRNGISRVNLIRTASADIINALTLDMFFDYTAVRLNGPDAAGKNIVLNFEFTDSSDEYIIDVSNGVLHYEQGARTAAADATVRLSRKGLIALTLLGIPLELLTASGALIVDGDAAALQEFVALLDNFEFQFNIVTP